MRYKVKLHTRLFEILKEKRKKNYQGQGGTITLSYKTDAAIQETQQFGGGSSSSSGGGGGGGNGDVNERGWQSNIFRLMSFPLSLSPLYDLFLYPW